MKIILRDFFFERGYIKGSILAMGRPLFQQCSFHYSNFRFWGKDYISLHRILARCYLSYSTQTDEMQLYQIQDLESTVEENSNFQKLCKLHLFFSFRKWISRVGGGKVGTNLSLQINQILFYELISFMSQCLFLCLQVPFLLTKQNRSECIE